ncbi:hypothetical protein [Streptomyces ossamyceticus]|uniref:hypothetical protein n=1 Tax=Streptomyces ossamyceticus TaxID=249581 RepID=UPI0006E32598|nr:hypothetical protein [Streptomyces ossamyceticus]
MNDETTRTTTSTSPAISGADEAVNRVLDASRDKIIAVLPEVVDKAAREAFADYTPEAAARIAETMIGILIGTICRDYPGVCTDTEPGHFDHFNHEHSVTNKDGEHILDVGFVQLSDGGPAAIYIGGMHHEDLRPEEVRAKTAELRRLLDQADEMADKVIAMTAVHAGGVQA